MNRTPFPGVALAWGAWACALVLAVPGFTHVAVPVALLAAVAATWLLQPGPRRAPSAALVTAGLGLLALWLVLGVLQQRPVLGGQVLWILPEHESASGSALGGPVRTGQLLFALENGLTAAALCAAAGLLLRVVTLAEWSDLLRLVLGRGSALVVPALVLVTVRAEESAARGARRPHGIAATQGRWGATARTAATRADELERIAAQAPRSRFGWVRLPVALVVTVAMAARAIVPGAERGPVLLVAALGALTALGLVLWRGQRPRWSPHVLPPVLGAVGLMTAAHFGAATDPLLLGCALAVLPAATLFTWEKKA